MNSWKSKILNAIYKSKKILNTLDLVMYLQFLYTRNYNLLFRKIKEELNNGETHHIHESEDSVSLRHQFFPNCSIRCMKSQSRFQKGVVLF